MKLTLRKDQVHVPRLQLTSTTSRNRGPWTPLMRVISISAVADGPETNVVGRVAVPDKRSNTSGTVYTTCPAKITHR